MTDVVICLCLAVEIPCGSRFDLLTRLALTRMRLLFFAINLCSDYCMHSMLKVSAVTTITISWFSGGPILRSVDKFCSH